MQSPYQWDFVKIGVAPAKAKRKGIMEVPRKDRIRADRERAREYVKSQLESIKNIAERIAVIQLLRTKDDPRDRQRILQCLANDKFPQQPCICNYGKAGRSKKHCTCTSLTA